MVYYTRANLWKKRGISVIPTCSRVTPFNQATALVHVYTDGSVLVTHGGMEMGQASISDHVKRYH